MSRKEIEHAEKAERGRVEKARKEKEKSDKKVQDKTEKDRKDKDKSDRKTQKKTDQDKIEKDIGDRKFEASERARKFDEVLGGAREKYKGCCETCNYQAKTSNGEYQPCKIGHKDSGPDKRICTDCSNPHYH